ncbi:MAG: ABC transporter permease [Anaerolineae bacterium]|jgi:ribose transport system permease protein|nr:ABC transporter permease [Chloroflexota bacterium]MBN8635104.1 ABC transporter permease [Anaerolineae bacterium]
MNANASRLIFGRISAGLGTAGFAALFFVVLLVINILLNPARFSPSALGVTIGLAAPLILAAIASTPVILAGGGGIDLSVGPFMGLVNVIVVQYLFMNAGISSPLVIIPAVIVIGLASGAINGFLASVVRIQPIVATLGTYLVYVGVTLWLMPAPAGDVPDWIGAFARGGSIVPILAIFAIWLLIRRIPLYDHIMALGGDDRAAYTSGIPVTTIRILAYMITGVFAAVAGVSLSALLGSADPTVGPTYTLNAIAAVALGGISLGGGKGSLIGATLGAVDIFLLQSILTFFNVSTFILQIAFGVILVIAIVLNAAPVQSALRRAGRH